MSSAPTEPSVSQPRRARRQRAAQQPPTYAPFLAELPDADALKPAIAAFSSGNYRELNRVCRQLLEHDEDPEVHAAARELLRRVEPDRFIVGVLWGSFALLVLLVLWAFGHQ